MKHNYRTLVLNADYYPLTTIGWKRAVVLDINERVLTISFYKHDSIKDGHGREYPIPAVVVSKKYIRRDYRYATFCRKNIFIRDKLICQYCGIRYETKNLTIDHVIPRSLWKKQFGAEAGSSTCWENIVTCCKQCNKEKADKTCRQADMFPINPPIRPSYGEMFIGISPFKNHTPAEWLPYLANLKSFIKHEDSV